MEESQKRENLLENVIIPTSSTSQHVKPKRMSFREWIDFEQKNKPQSNALMMGAMVMASGAMQFAWGCANHITISHREVDMDLFLVIISWFAAAVVGFFLSGLMVMKNSKISIYLISLMISCISWALLILDSKKFVILMVSRVLGGFGFGLAYPTILVHASEVSVTKLRFVLVSCVHFLFVTGVFIGLMSTLEIGYDQNQRLIDPITANKIVGMIMVIIGTFLGFLFHRESPIYYLKKNQEHLAVDVMKRLRSETNFSEDIRQDIQDYKELIHEDSKMSLNIFGRGNIIQLLTLLVLKIATASTINATLNIFLLKSTSQRFSDGRFDPAGLIIIGTRFLSTLIVLYLLDLKRTFFMRISFISTTIILFSIAATINIFGDGSIAIIILGILLQISSSALGCISDNYAIEAFDLRKKPLSIAITSIFEFGFHAASVALFFYIDDFIDSVNIIVNFGGFIMLLATIISFKIPNTINMTLRNARFRIHSN